MMTPEQRANNITFSWNPSTEPMEMRWANYESIVAVIKAAVADEREACAKIADDHDCNSGGGAHGVLCQHIISGMIRARGTA